MADKTELLEKVISHEVTEAQSQLGISNKQNDSSCHSVPSASLRTGLVAERDKLPMDNILEDTLIGIWPAALLTKREAEILKLIVRGNTNKKIAQKLYRVERTIEYHRNQIMRKLGARNVADLVKRAIAMGIV
jgi:DNA-binding CsgD family transcriptional regulator